MFLASVGTYVWVLREPVASLKAIVIDIAIGIVMPVQRTWQANNGIWEVVIDFGLPYFWISISLNVLLTLMIVIRLVTARTFVLPWGLQAESVDYTRQ